VLSIGKLAAGAGGYYTAMVADGAEEYFTGAREAPGEWVGRASDDLALVGTVQSEAFADVLDHRFPGTDVQITASRSAPTVVAFDATFCAPKSVSVLHGLGSPDVAVAMSDAHDVSVFAALGVLEDEASRGRRGHGGVEIVEGDGFVAAAFRHRTSRAGDPHLHTHVVIANLVHGPDDRWTALDARPLYHWAKTVGYLYEAQLRHEVTQRLSAEWTAVRRGIADLTAVPRPVIDEFSTRRREIEAHLEASGFDSARAAQVATYATRRMKDHSTTVETLADGWRQRAERLGFDPLVASEAIIVGPGSSAPVSDPIDKIFVDLAGPHGLTQHRSTFGRREVIQAICERLPNGAPVSQVIEWAERFIESEHCVELVDHRSPTIRTSTGGSVSARTDQVRYSTPDIIATERHLVESALRRANDKIGWSSVDDIYAAFDARPTLSDEQASMVWRICGQGRGVDLVEGVAGAGKTFALAAANDAWTRSGHQVIGCSLAAKAARQLEADAAIPSQTIDRLLIDLDRAEHGGFAASTVVVVDEAAMVGTRKLLRLLEHAERDRAKVVLVGDPRQLPEIQAGGGHVGLSSRLGHATLHHNRRQHEGWERRALARMREGRTDEAIDAYLDHGRVVVSSTGSDARTRMLHDWMDARSDQTTVMLASRVADIDQLNAAAREMLRAEGVIGPDQLTIGSRGFVQGDLVLALRNDRRLDVLNGTRAVIEDIDIERRTLRCRGDDQRVLTIPFDYVEQGHLTHAYAMTIHKSQGATFDRCFVLAGDQLTKESAYTAMSRGRFGNDLYVLDDDARVDEAHMSEQRGEPLDTLRSSVRRSNAQTMAIDHGQALASAPEPAVDDDLGIDI